MKICIRFATIHFNKANKFNYVMAGSLIIGGTLALLEPAVYILLRRIYESTWAGNANT